MRRHSRPYVRKQIILWGLSHHYFHLGCFLASGSSSASEETLGKLPSLLLFLI